MRAWNLGSNQRFAGQTPDGACAESIRAVAEISFRALKVTARGAALPVDGTQSACAAGIGLYVPIHAIST